MIKAPGQTRRGGRPSLYCLKTLGAAARRLSQGRWNHRWRWCSTGKPRKTRATWFTRQCRRWPRDGCVSH